MSEQAKVTVVIPTYNRAELLKQAVESVRAQTLTNWELIIVSDGSSDHTTQVAESLAAEDSRIRWIHQENRGLAGARNTGIRMSNGEYIAFLDDDDYFHPEALFLQMNYLRDHPEAGFVYGQWEVTDAKGKVYVIEPETPVLNLEELFEQCLIRPSVVMCRKDILEQVGMFDESMSGCEDYDLWLRIALKAPFGFIAKPLAQWRIHGSNMSLNSLRMNRIRAKILQRIPVVPSKGITYWRKQRRLAANEFRAGRMCREAQKSMHAAGYFLRAVSYYPSIGITMADPKPKGWRIVWMFIKPYLGIGVCLWEAATHSGSASLKKASDTEKPKQAVTGK